jgi:hypothetical protein
MAQLGLCFRFWRPSPGRTGRFGRVVDRFCRLDLSRQKFRSVDRDF